MTRTFDVVAAMRRWSLRVVCRQRRTRSRRQAPPVARDIAAELACAPTAADDACRRRHCASSAARITARTHVRPRRTRWSSAAAPRQGLQLGQQLLRAAPSHDPFDAHRRDGTPASDPHRRLDRHRRRASDTTAIATVDARLRRSHRGRLPRAVHTADRCRDADAAPGAARLRPRRARLVVGDERPQMAAPGVYMLIDRGSDHGHAPRQRVTIYRDIGGSGPPRHRRGNRAGEPALDRLIRVGEATSDAAFVRRRRRVASIDRRRDLMSADVGADRR